jgi:predicted molibdopterin-dependent oxidoreductase YjgC
LNGTPARVSWEEALTYLAERIEMVRRRHGGKTIGLWASSRATNEELLLLRRIACQGLQTKAVRFDPFLHPLDQIPPSFVEGPQAARLEEIQAADLLLVFGHGLAEHHAQAASRIVKAMDQGGRAVVISPRRDVLYRGATLSLQVDGLEEVAFALADPERGSLDGLRQMWSDAGRPLLIYALGSLPPIREARLHRTFASLLTKGGSKVLLLFPRANSRGAFHQGRGLAVPESPDPKALVVVEENPAAWNGGFRAMMEGVEFLVVQDLFLTETAELAHVVLPCAAFAEKAGTLTNTEGRQQELHPAVLPPGDARPGWAILAELARRLGISDVGSTLDEIRRSMRLEQVADVSLCTAPEPVSCAAADPPRLQHIPDRLGYFWLTDTVLRHTDDWQREHQDRWIEVHPEDAKELSLRPGWMVRVAWEGGDFTATVQISDRVGRGFVCRPHALVEGPVTLDRAA